LPLQIKFCKIVAQTLKYIIMKIKFGAVIVDGRGKIGGHVASKNRGGAYMRTKVTPTNPSTTSQAAVRNRLTSFAQSFRSLTASQIQAWNAAVSDFAKTDSFGDIKQPSGVNLYMKLNSNLAEVGVVAILTPPLPAEVEPVISVSATATAGVPSFSVVFTPTPVPANTAFILRATAQVSPGISNLSGKFRNIDILDAASASPENALAAYTAKFGTLVAGRKIAIELVPVNKTTGQKGQAVSATLVVGA
jgi:hypothetical protein